MFCSIGHGSIRLCQCESHSWGQSCRSIMKTLQKMVLALQQQLCQAARRLCNQAHNCTSLQDLFQNWISNQPSSFPQHSKKPDVPRASACHCFLPVVLLLLLQPWRISSEDPNLLNLFPADAPLQHAVYAAAPFLHEKAGQALCNRRQL